MNKGLVVYEEFRFICEFKNRPTEESFELSKIEGKW